MRRRSRGDGAHGWLLVALVVLAFALGAGLEAAAVDTGSVGRDSSVDVTTDENGAYGIAVASSVHVNRTETLVTVSNELGREVTATVTLRPDSTDRGDLVLGGTNVGDEASFGLADGEARTVEVAVPANDSLGGTTVNFDLEADGSGVTVTATNRSVPIEVTT